MVYYFKQTGVSRTYSLSYNANGGAGAPATQSAGSTASSYSFQVSSTVPTRDGHTFLGWADSATASSAQYHAGDSVTLSSSSPSKTLYAVWSKNPDPLYTLTVATSPVGGTTSGGGSYAQGSNVSISATAPTAPEGKVYVFDEWISNAGGSFGNPALAGTSFVMPASNVTVTARYLLKDDANHKCKPDRRGG